MSKSAKSHHDIDKHNAPSNMAQHATDKSHHAIDKKQHASNMAQHATDKSHHAIDKHQHASNMAHESAMDMAQQAMDKTSHAVSLRRMHHTRPKLLSLPISNPDYDLVSSIYPFTMRDLNGIPVCLEKYKGHVCILVNVASKSAFAEHNYKLLNKLYANYGDSAGLRILAFPCDQFNHTEHGSNREIKRFLERKGVKFDVFSKISINCKNTHPLWKYMKTKVENTGNKWKLALVTDPFTKFVVSRSGVPTARFNSGASEDEITEALEPLFESYNKLLNKKSIVLQAVLPPPLEEEDLPCKRSWHFEPGILKLI